MQDKGGDVIKQVNGDCMGRKKKRILLLVNSVAGTGSAKGKLYDVISELAVHHCETTVYPIIPEAGLESETIIQDCGNDYDVIMCFGGDGTLNHVIRGVLSAELSIPIGYLPGGSTNDFARSLGLSPDIKKACAAVIGENIFLYDIGRFNESYFNYVAAFGAFTKVSYSTNQGVKNALGYAAYILESIHTLPESVTSRCRLQIEHDGIVEKGEYLFGAISNSLSVGGLASPAIKNAALDDGMFEVMLIRAPDTVADLGEIVTTLASGSLDNRHVKVFTTEALKIMALNNVAWTLDGEYGGSPSIVNIRVLPKAVRIMLP